MKILIIGKGYDNSFGIGKMYLEFAKQIAIHIEGSDRNLVTQVLFPYSQYVDKDVDLVIIPGGADVQDFSVPPSVYTGQPDQYFEYFDKVMLPRYIAEGIPIFGICRGFQSLNVVFGGTLHQELGNHTYSDVREKGRGHRAHEVEMTKAFEEQIGGISKNETLKVNSMHHQGIDELSEELVPLIMAKDKKWTFKSLIESFIHNELPIAGVQWHPEELYCKISLNIVKRIMNRAGELDKERLDIILGKYDIE